MTARIFCKVGELRGLSEEIGDEATLGRSRQATIPLRAELISGEHARIRYDPTESCYVLQDLGSTNGTELDGMRVRGKERLGHLHVITLAECYDLIFQDLGLCEGQVPESAPESAPEGAPEGALESTPEPPARENTAVQEMPPILPGAITGDSVPEDTSIDSAPLGLPSALLQRAEEVRAEEVRAEEIRAQPPVRSKPEPPAPKRPPEPPPTVKLPDDFPAMAAATAPSPPQEVSTQLEVETEDLAFALEVYKAEGSARFRLNDGENVVGRTDECDVKLDTMDVSRRHAMLEVRGGGVTVRDLGSSNHTFLEGTRVTDTARVPVGAKLRFGSLEAGLTLWEAEEDT